MRCSRQAIARGCAALVAAGMSLMAAGDAFAWSRFHDHVYADSFGNLVVQSPNGYKRIVVGQGHMADKLSQYERGDDPSVVYLDEDDDDDAPYAYRDCYRPPYLFKGRSYMYGLADGELPQAPCADE
jgi:hypothetical protein